MLSNVACFLSHAGGQHGIHIWVEAGVKADFTRGSLVQTQVTNRKRACRPVLVRMPFQYCQMRLCKASCFPLAVPPRGEFSYILISSSFVHVELLFPITFFLSLWAHHVSFNTICIRFSHYFKSQTFPHRKWDEWLSITDSFQCLSLLSLITPWKVFTGQLLWFQFGRCWAMASAAFSKFLL